MPPPKLLKTRYEDTDNGRIFYVNEETDARYLSIPAVPDPGSKARRGENPGGSDKIIT